MYGAIDVGGTKTLIALFNENGDIEHQEKFKTPKDYTEFSTQLIEVLKKLDTSRLKRIVIAMPGRIDRDRGVAVSFGNLPWENIPIQADLEKELHCPVLAENDANLAGLSEALLVKDQYRKVLYITVSTGIGGVMIIDGKIDPNTQDAEVGHLLLEHGGKLQRWEKFASGKAIVARTGKRASDIPEDASEWYGIARNIAIGLIDLVATLTPEAVVIGGGVGTHFDKFKEHLNEQMKIYDNPMITLPVIMGAKNAETAVIYGCYELAKQNTPE